MPETLTCKYCGAIEHLRWNPVTIDRLRRLQLCFNCNFWEEHYERNQTMDKDTCVIVEQSNGTRHHYRICREPKPNECMMLGHAGARFVIHFNDGRTVISHNLWNQGDIPKHFYDKFPVNATME
jgi:hypothetical protein